MNLFFLDINPEICAMYHCDKHVVKMILELCQMLYTAHHMLKTENLPLDRYRPFSPQHPTCIWVRLSLENYNYTVNVVYYLCKEYTHRYNKIHTCQKHVDWLRENIPTFKNVEFPYQKNKKTVVLRTNALLQEHNLTPLPLAMPENCIRNDPIKSYRKYYLLHKVRFATWKKQHQPWWFTRLHFNGM